MTMFPTHTSASVASEAMKKLCGSVSMLSSCKTSIAIPTAKVKMGKVPWFKYNSCKTKFRYGFGWTCIPGTDKVMIEAPVGIEFGTKQVSSCTLAKAAMPGLGDIILKSGQMCKCIPDVS